jgi:hypothetical protein
MSLTASLTLILFATRINLKPYLACKAFIYYLNSTHFNRPRWKRRAMLSPRRYYDGMLCTLGLLHVSANFKIYLQG